MYRSSILIEMAEIIYNKMFEPDAETGYYIMPPFEKAQEEKTLGYNRSLAAADALLDHIVSAGYRRIPNA